MSAEVLLALSTFPDVETARRIARQLVEENLAACANLIPTVHSIYRWKGEVEESQEVMVVFKMTRTRFAELSARLKQLHPYDVPELIAFEATDGLPDYLRWVAESCEPAR